MLLKVQGVHSLKIDAKLGNIVISGIVDPATIITMLEKHGRKAQLLWEQGIPIKDSPIDKASHVHSGFEEGHNLKNVQIITQSNKVINPLNDPDIMNQLEELSRIPGLQTMEAPPPSTSSSSMPHAYYSVLSDENVNGCIIL
ncbi:hypothetical protein H5410_029195 [Solanum commersonii]|uniref:HMA domain-containing protein n=1 Tax=Solanum commersonii TaxID=4109 RepID=A0A9J5Z727_SOLCO|nr:hypothetical protein H5410_029195 [Solanum commersonii]